MKTIGFVLAISLCAPAFAQSGRIFGGSVARKNFEFFWESRLEPPVPPLSDSVQMTTLDSNPEMIQRIVKDRSRKIYLGYDVLVEVLPQASTYRLTVRPLSAIPEDIKKDPAGLTRIEVSGFPAPQAIRSGDVVAIDLLANGATGQKIVDYITIREPRRPVSPFDPQIPREFSWVAGQPRDFSVEDAGLRIRAPRLRINGKLDESSTNFNLEVAGSVVWFYAANRGRFVLSLTPQRALGFQKAGEVRGNTLMFTIGSDTFNIDAASRIAPGDAPLNLYVFHDPAWRPTYAHADQSAFNMGSADRAEWLVRGTGPPNWGR